MLHPENPFGASTNFHISVEPKQMVLMFSVHRLLLENF